LSDLLVIEFASERKAEGVRELLLAMHSECLIDPPDAVVALQDASGRLKLNQLFEPGAQGDRPAAFWNALIGPLCRLPVQAAESDAVHAGQGHLRALGIGEDFRRRAARMLSSGNGVLFLLIRSATTDKVLAALRGAGGPVLHGSLAEAAEAYLQRTSP
jgi:uncharacterized membrane protein